MRSCKKLVGGRVVGCESFTVALNVGLIVLTVSISGVLRVVCWRIGVITVISIRNKTALNGVSGVNRGKEGIVVTTADK